MDLISNFMCTDAGQRLTVAVLFIALVLKPALLRVEAVRFVPPFVWPR